MNSVFVSNLVSETTDENCTREDPHVWFGVICILLVIVGLLGNALVVFLIIVLEEYKKSVANL